MLQDYSGLIVIHLCRIYESLNRHNSCRTKVNQVAPVEQYHSFRQLQGLPDVADLVSPIILQWYHTA